MARQMRSGVAGMSMWSTPNSESASISALATAGSAPTVPASPAPLTPSGLVLVGRLRSWRRERDDGGSQALRERTPDGVVIGKRLDHLRI